MNVISRLRQLAGKHLPVAFANDVLDSCSRVLIDLEALATIIDCVAFSSEAYATLVSNLAGRHRLYKVPVVIAANKPSKPDLRVVKQVLFPVVAHALEFDAPHQQSDHSQPGARKL